MSMAMGYAMNKKRMAKGGCADCAAGSCMAHGGAVGAPMDASADDDDLVLKIMKKRYSQGGAVANDTEPVADFEPNEFDVLVKSGGMDGEYVGDDEIGDEKMDEDDSDVVSKIMKSRSKKDRNPRPA